MDYAPPTAPDFRFRLDPVEMRLTIPAREALLAAGNFVEPLRDGVDAVAITRPPRRLKVVIAPDVGAVREPGQYPAQVLAVRRVDEPPFPGEMSAAWWDRALVTPCPDCGMALVWAEAGYVPGWRLCLHGHASQLSGDGKTAERHPDSDSRTRRAVSNGTWPEDE